MTPSVADMLTTMDDRVRAQVLLSAAEAVLHDRCVAYGECPENSFSRIAKLWAAYLDLDIKPHDVAALMALLKIARIEGNPRHRDSWVDLAGYAACGAECAEGQPA